MALITLYLAKKKEFDPSKHKTFIHYWLNEDENFPEFRDIDSFLEENYEGYEWIESPIKLIREDIKQAVVETSGNDFNSIEDLFIKVVDDSVPFPMYYKSTDIRQVSNQNSPDISYQIICPMDMWSTFGARMINLLKDFPEDVYMIRKMCDRYIFTDQGNTIDYNTQIWLKQQGNYNYPLIKDQAEEEVYSQEDDTAKLTLEKWLYINSIFPDFEGWKEMYDKWYNNPWLGIKNIEDGQPYDAFLTDNTGAYLQNSYGISMDQKLISDENYNSNGLYRYIVLKTGNNLEKPGYTKGVIFNNNIFNYNNGSTEPKKGRFNGEELLILPIIKDNFNLYDTKNPTIHFLNNASGLRPGSGSILGSPINDIPPLILAAGSRLDNSISENTTSQTISDVLSARTAEDGIANPYCPFSLTALHHGSVNLHHFSKENSEVKDEIEPNGTKQKIIGLFSNMNYLPIVLAQGVSWWPEDKQYYNDTIDGNSFFNTFRRLTSDVTINGFSNIKHDQTREYMKRFWDTSYNTLQCEPFFYAPQFYNWTYLSDGNNRLCLTADMIDISLLNRGDWKIWLNVMLGERSYYKLDLKKLKNKLYPFSKSFSELTTTDDRIFPYSSEQYYNWLQNNENTINTSRNSLNIQQGFGAASNVLGILSVIAMGLINPIAGLAAGAVGIGLGATKNELEWHNKWNGMMENLYQSPTQLSAVGFASGSLNYSSNGLSTTQTKFDYKLFRTYCLPEYAKREIWNDISMQGYFFKSQDLFKTYDNRVNFNYVKTDLSAKWFNVYNYMKQNLSQISLLLTQAEWINWFRSKLNSGVRLFKVHYDGTKMNDLILNNIENSYQKPIPQKDDVGGGFPIPKFTQFKINTKFDSVMADTWDWGERCYLYQMWPYGGNWRNVDNYTIKNLRVNSFYKEIKTPMRPDGEYYWTDVASFKEVLGNKQINISFTTDGPGWGVEWKKNGWYWPTDWDTRYTQPKTVICGKIKDIDDNGVYTFVDKKTSRIGGFDRQINKDNSQWLSINVQNSWIGPGSYFAGYYREVESVRFDFDIISTGLTRVYITLTTNDVIHTPNTYISAYGNNSYFCHDTKNERWETGAAQHNIFFNTVLDSISIGLLSDKPPGKTEPIEEENTSIDIELNEEPTEPVEELKIEE